MKTYPIYQNGEHQWLVFAQDAERPENLIDTNQVVVMYGNEVLMCDPGGLEIFPQMMAALTEHIPVDDIAHIFLSHQDPDVASALPVWRQVCKTGLKVHISWLWEGFVRHFDSTCKFESLPDQGGPLRLGKVNLSFIPAHYMHSSGNFNLWDPVAKILFTGDIGAAMLPHGYDRGIFVTDFNAHTHYMEGFHKRWLGSPRARDVWVSQVRKLAPEMLVPQHGLIFRGEDVTRFLDWLSRLEIGSGITG